MSYKGYVKQIIRRLKCPKKQKLEIKRQLEADIQAALSGHETMEEIIERMGTPVS